MNLLINLPPHFFTQPELQDRFKDLANRFIVRQTSHNTPEEIVEDLKWADAVLMWSWPVLDESLLQAAGSLQFAGHIDITQIGAKAELAAGIPVSCSRSGWSPAVAEMALGLILNGLRHISDYHASMRLGEETWVQNFPRDIHPLERELSGRSVGIVGLGKVGQRLAHFLKAFEVDLKVVDPHVSQEVVDALGGKRMDVDEMIENSDVIVLCAASNEGTSRLINAERIKKMRSNSLFINVARSALVDTEALIERLEKGDLYAALDVFDQEPLSKDSALRNLKNAYLTPHRAGGLMSSVQRTIDWLVKDLDLLLAGKNRRYPVVEAMIPALDA